MNPFGLRALVERRSSSTSGDGWVAWQEFAPDLVIESTFLCDRGCRGCYAPNLVSQATGDEVLAANPGLFLQPEALSIALRTLQRSAGSAAIRGGEPTRHPHLMAILQVVCASVPEVYLETHGGWIEGERRLVEFCRDRGIIVKISFDRMHGRRSHELLTGCERLQAAGVDYLVAITEPTIEEYQKSRRLCSWVPDDQIIFQPLATWSAELLTPPLGVIGVTAARSWALTVLPTFA